MSIVRFCRVAAFIAAISISAPGAFAADFSFTGTFNADDNIKFFTFTVPATTTSVVMRTWSYAGGTNAAGASIPRGGFDPFLSLFDAAGNLIAQNEDGTGFVATDPVTGAAFDSYLPAGPLVLTPGVYTLVLTQSGNQPNGATLADGFTEQGMGNYTVSFGCTNGFFCDITTDNRNGSWALDILNVGAAAAVAPAILKSFGAALIPVGGNTSLSFTINNTNTSTLTGVGFTDTLPGGLLVSTPNGLAGACGGGIITATAGSNTVTLTGATLNAGASCTFSINVTGITTGPQNNLTGNVVADQGTGNQAAASTTVIAPAPPSIAKAFNPATITVNGNSVLTFTIMNPNVIPLTGVGFTDPLPVGLSVGGAAGFSIPGCGAATNFGAIGNNISLSGATIPAGGTCIAQITVIGSVDGIYVNTTSAVTSNEAGAGNTASASITVQPVINAGSLSYLVGYAANLLGGDSYVNITNTGTLNGFDPAGRICVNAYAFDPSEEMVSCCTCLVTPDGLRSLSVKQDLVSNTLTPGVPGSVVIKLVTTVPVGGNTCNAASPTATTLAGGTRAWGTSLHQNTASGKFELTENAFQASELSVTEFSKLTTYCGFIQSNGSGFGVCKSCRVGGLGGDKQ